MIGRIVLTRLDAVEIAANWASTVNRVHPGLTCEVQLLHDSTLERAECHLSKRSTSAEEDHKSKRHASILERDLVDLPGYLVCQLVVTDQEYLLVLIDVVVKVLLVRCTCYCVALIGEG